VIIGPPGSGRRALIEAWRQRLPAAGPLALRGFGFNIDNYHGGGVAEWRGELVGTYACVHPRCIIVFSRFGRELATDTPEYQRFPALEEQLGIALTVPRLIDRLTWRARERWRDFAAHADLMSDRPLTPATARGSTVEDCLRRAIAKPYDDAAIDRFLRRVAEPLATLVGNAQRFRELVAVDAALRGGLTA
jgi:hypothetical protein